MSYLEYTTIAKDNPLQLIKKFAKTRKKDGVDGKFG